MSHRKPQHFQKKLPCCYQIIPSRNQNTIYHPNAEGKWPIRGETTWISCFLLSLRKQGHQGRLSSSWTDCQFTKPRRRSLFHQSKGSEWALTWPHVTTGTRECTRSKYRATKYTLYLEKPDGEYQRYCCTSNSWANEIWQSTPHQEGHSDIKGAAQCSGGTLPRLSCLEAYFMLQKERRASIFVCFCQGKHCSLMF